MWQLIYAPLSGSSKASNFAFGVLLIRLELKGLIFIVYKFFGLGS